MGIDLLDISFRVKDELGVTLNLAEFFDDGAGPFWQRTPPDVTPRELYAFVVSKASQQSVVLPANAEDVFLDIIASVLWLKRRDFCTDDLLMRDLGLE